MTQAMEATQTTRFLTHFGIAEKDRASDFMGQALVNYVVGDPSPEAIVDLDDGLTHILETWGLVYGNENYVWNRIVNLASRFLASDIDNETKAEFRTELAKVLS